MNNEHAKSLLDNLHQDYDLLINDQIQIDIERRYSLPDSTQNPYRKLITTSILEKIKKINQNHYSQAVKILIQFDDEQFQSDREDQILHNVLVALELIQAINLQQDQQQRNQYLKQLGAVIGKRNPNIMSYIENQPQDFKFVCFICYNTYYLKAELSQQLECNHNYCQSCYKEYIYQRIMNGHSDNIKCPDAACQIKISDEYIREQLGEDIFKKMKKFRKIKAELQNPKVMQCPKIGCEEFVIKQKQVPFLKCTCGQEICKKCGQPYHPDLSCSELMDRDFKKAQKKFLIQKCNKCRAPIQKFDGCNHMTCYQCGYEFCWLCRSQFSQKHFDTYNICGCPGMQFTHRDPYKYPNLYRFLFILALVILGPPGIIITLAVGFIIGVLGLPVFIYGSITPYEFFKRYSTCKKFIIKISLFFSCIIFSPLSLLAVFLGIFAGIIIGIPYLIYYLIEYCRD